MITNIIIKLNSCLLVLITHIGFFLNVQEENSFKISGNLPEKFNGSKVELRIISDNYMNPQPTEIMSAFLTNGRFNFEGTINEAAKRASITVEKDGKKYLGDFILDSGFNLASLKNHSLYERVLVVDIKSESNTLKAAIDSIASNAYDSERRRLGNTTGALVLEKDKSFIMTSSIIDQITKFPDNYYSLIALNHWSHYTSMEGHETMLLEKFQFLSENIKKKPLGKDLENYYRMRIKGEIDTRVLSKAPDFNFTTIDGRKINSNSLSGAPYIVAFSATWCTPCKIMEPKLVTLYNKYKDLGLQVVYLSIDQAPEKFKTYAEHRKLPWLNVNLFVDGNGGNERMDSFNVSYIPYYLLVDQEQIVKYNIYQEQDPNLVNLEKQIRQTLSIN